MSINIGSIKNRLLVKYPAFGSIIANVKFEESYSKETAATDGEIIYYNPTFIEPLSSDEQVFLLAHEVCHIAFDHIFRSEGKDHTIWNIATDAVINALLVKDGLPLIKGGVDIKDAINHTAEEMYKKLYEEQKENSDGKESGNSTSNGSGGDGSTSSSNESNEIDNVGHDNHGLWKKTIEKRKNSSSNSGEKKSSSTSNNDSNSQNDSSDMNNIEDEIKKMSEQGEIKTFKENSKERLDNLKKLRDSLVKQSYGAGNTTNSNQRNIDNIGVAKPLIDWRLLLREAIKFDVDWTYQDATIEDGVLTPHLQSIPYPETEIVLDTSGSIDEELLRNFLRECKNILKTSKVKVGCFDTKFYGFHEIKSKDDIDTVPLVGGGGTDFDVAVNAFSKRVENKIIFTDGDADMPKESDRIIWIVFGNKKINPLGGKVIYISNEDLRKMGNISYGGRSR